MIFDYWLFGELIILCAWHSFCPSATIPLHIRAEFVDCRFSVLSLIFLFFCPSIYLSLLLILVKRTHLCIITFILYVYIYRCRRYWLHQTLSTQWLHFRTREKYNTALCEVLSMYIETISYNIQIYSNSLVQIPVKCVTSVFREYNLTENIKCFCTSKQLHVFYNYYKNCGKTVNIKYLRFQPLFGC